MQHQVLLDDPILSKLGISLQKINAKCIHDFLRRREALASSHSTTQGSAILTRIKSISSLSLPDTTTTRLPITLEQNKRHNILYTETTCRAGQKTTKREDLAKLESRENRVKSEQDTSSLDSSSLQASSTFTGATSVQILFNRWDSSLLCLVRCLPITVPILSCR